MSVIIRLQNLPWTANALDIRRFFSGLSVPDGGVHIVGGEKGDAFIAFSTDEDARRAMLLDGGRVGTNTLKLFLSSKTEMQNVIAVARGGAPGPAGGSNQMPPPQMGGPPPHSSPFQQAPNMPGLNFGPPQQQGYPQGAVMIAPQNVPNQGPMRGNVQIDQRPPGMPPQYGSPQPMEPMVPQGRPVDRPPWDNREPDPRDRNDFVRREMRPPVVFDRPRDVEPRSFNGHGPMDGGPVMDRPMDGGPVMDRPMDDFREHRPRDDFRGPSPRRDGFSPPRERFVDDRRDSRKRPFEEAFCARVSNLPLPLNYRDVRKFFTGLEIPRNGLKLINDRGGQRIGEAFVMFATEEQAKSALRMDGWMVKGYNVRIEPCNVESFERVIDSFIPGGGPVSTERPMQKRPRSRSPPKQDDHSLTIVVKNLPFATSKRDIFKFLTGVKFAKGDLSVNIEHSRDGRMTGVALIELLTPRDLDTALRMHRKCEMGGRSIELIHISKKEYKERVERSEKNAPKDVEIPEKRSSEKKVDHEKSQGKDAKIVKPESKTKSTPDKKDTKCYCVKLYGIPFTTEKADIQKFFSGLQIANKGIRLVFLPNGKVSTTCFVEFVSSEDCKKALVKDNEHIGPRYIKVSPVTKQQMMDEFHSLTDNPNGRSGGPPPGSSSVANQVGKPGCVVGIQNLHFNSTLEDILHFFKGFGPIANSVKMRYNLDGRPMGDAMLAFHVRQDAQRAVAEMDRRNLLGRPVKLAFM